MPISSVGKIKNSRGVTLIELTIALAIIGMITALSYPSFLGGLESVRMASTTDSVSTFLNSAVTRAERRQLAVGLVISPKEGQLLMYSNEPGFERKLKMPNGISIKAVLPAIEGQDADAPRRLVLLPGATAPGIGILLASQHGTQRLVRLDPMTGFPRVERVNSK
jgi:prepilin-type N-terminal cleavage/methylation domain-containing protein